MLYITFCVDVQTRPHVYERVGALFNLRDQQVDRWLSILPSEDHNEQQAICLIGRSLLKRLALATAFALALVAAGCTGSNSNTSASSQSSEATQDTGITQSEDDVAGLVDIGGGRQMYLECRGT